MRFIEVEAKSKEDAIEKAARELGVPNHEIGIEVLSDGSKGFFGFVSGRKVKIRAWSKRESRELEEDDEAIGKNRGNLREPSSSVSLSAKAQEAKDILVNLLAWLSDKADVEAIETEDAIRLAISGDPNGLLIGKRGQTLDALQYLLNKMVNRSESEWKRIEVDMEQYRNRREESLKKMALRLGEKAKKKKRAVTIEAMNAHDRRIIHLALKSDSSLETRSIGKGEMRKLVIKPLNASRSKGHETTGDLS